MGAVGRVGSVAHEVFSAANADEEHAVAVVGLDRRGAGVARQLHRPLEPAIGDLHPVVTAALLNAPVVAHALDAKHASVQRDSHFGRPHPGQVGFDEPAVAELVDIEGRLPAEVIARRAEESGAKDAVPRHGQLVGWVRAILGGAGRQCRTIWRTAIQCRSKYSRR